MNQETIKQLLEQLHQEEREPKDLEKMNITNIMLYMKKEAYEETTIKKAAKLLRHLQQYKSSKVLYLRCYDMAEIDDAMLPIIKNNKGIGKVVFVSSVSVLIIALVALGLVMYIRMDSLQSDYNSLKSTNSQLQNNYNSLQNTDSQLQRNYDSLQTQYNQLSNEYQQLLSSINASESSQIASLRSQLLNATALIAELKGPTGILPTYMDLGYEGPIAGGSGAGYFLELSLKNTGPIPITQIFVSIKSVQIPMTFSNLNTTINQDKPLPSYQTATGRQNLSPITLIEDKKTYLMVLQATTSNGTIYTYQTTIIGHV